MSASVYPSTSARCCCAGKPVNTLYVARKMKLAREMYFAILLDRSSAGPIMIGCSEGGTSIEDLAEKSPEKIIRVHVDVREGITDEQANRMAEGLEVTGDRHAAAQQVKNLYHLFTQSDCTMVEVRAQLVARAELAATRSIAEE